MEEATCSKAYCASFANRQQQAREEPGVLPRSVTRSAGSTRSKSMANRTISALMQVIRADHQQRRRADDERREQDMGHEFDRRADPRWRCHTSGIGRAGSPVADNGDVLEPGERTQARRGLAMPDRAD